LYPQEQSSIISTDYRTTRNDNPERLQILSIKTSLDRVPRELKLFIVASFIMGMAFAMFDSTFNNFLNERYALDGFQRSFLEFPRELPGVVVIFVSALFCSMSSRRLGVVSLLLALGGVILIGFAAPSYLIMVLWLFAYSLGQHLFMPISSSIGMELAEKGKIGKRLGQLNAIRNLALICGGFLVFLGFKFLGFTFEINFVLIALGLGIAGILMFSMKPEGSGQNKTFLKLHKEYKLYYFLMVLSGSRKQLFLTFAPWVIVTIFNQPTQTMATLMTIGGVIGILFQPFLGRMIDRLGERIILATEAVLLVVVCIGYGFSKFWLPENIAFFAVCVFFLLDQMLFSVGMARSMYMKKIALQPADVQPALTAGLAIDHIFSISVALIGGVIWDTFGFQYVFMLGVLIAVINFFTALKVRTPKQVI
jgi:predicted MFS family arabinose efflux permease